ncbi:Uncharacterized protein FKW44_009740 [Caligus rogercresseyi]|uniref:Uncharacterized protein n=1 Tax=Caligus rogercresseyi TaxID=217165 RepID=A0A7T8K8J1_CALRO|nr:Uncharacterized protein FKW44_009740 [Caligus rogercresseyi]
MILKVDGCAKRYLVETNPSIRAAGEFIPTVTLVEAYKYLGFKVNSNGFVGTNVLQDLKSCLGYLDASELRTDHKLISFKKYVWPRHIYILTRGEYSMEYLKKLDIVVNVWVRKICELFPDTPNVFIHASVADGGLGFPTYQVNIPLTKLERLKKLRASEDQLVVRESQDCSWAKSVREPKIARREVLSGGSARSAWADDLYAKVDTKA